MSVKYDKPKGTKHVCSYLKVLLNRTIIAVPPLAHIGKVYSDDTEKTNILNNFFVDIANSANKTCAPPPCYEKPVLAPLTRIQTTSHEVKDLLQNLNVSKATGPDGISNRMLKETAISISPSVSQIYNISLDTRTLLFVWKQANVVPILYLVKQIYTITTSQLNTRILECLVFNQMSNFLKANGQLTMWQSGFRERDNTVY